VQGFDSPVAADPPVEVGGVAWVTIRLVMP